MPNKSEKFYWVVKANTFVQLSENVVLKKSCSCLMKANMKKDFHPTSQINVLRLNIFKIE
jgi:hypothetical protein